MRRLPAILASLALVALGATACESAVTGQVLYAGDFTVTDSAPWATEALLAGSTGLLPTVSSIDDVGVRDVGYWVDRLAALEAANGGFDAVVLSLGINDARDADLTPDLVGRIGAIADAAANGDQVVMWATLNEATPGRAAGSVAFNAALRTAATTRPTLRIIDFGAELQTHPTYLAADGVRWSRAGQEAFGARVNTELATIHLDPGLTVQMTTDETTVVSGNPIHHHITITNTGGMALHNVTVADPVAPDCAGPLPDLAAGTAHTVDCVYTATAADVGTFTNTATVDTDETVPVVSNQVTVSVTAPAGPGTVSGTVSETGSGSPLAGAWVAALRTSDFSLAGGATADAGGGYAIPVPAGSYFLYVIDPAGAHTAGFFGAPTPVTVTSGSVFDADPVVASNRGTVAGTVVDAGSNAAIPGALTVAFNGSTTLPEGGATANGSGQFGLGGLRPGTHFVGFVDPAGGHQARFYPNSPNLPASTPPPVTAGATTTANASLPTQALVGTGALLSGTVTDAGTAAPLAGVYVLALRAADYQIVRAATTNASGAYTLNVVAGDYKLIFFDSTGRHDMEWHDNLPLTGIDSAASVTAPATANAALNPSTGSMAGTIVDDPAATPVPGAWVLAIGPTGIAGGAVTAANGTYTVGGLAPGTYRATFVDPNGGRTQEYFDNSPTYTGATTFNITAGATTTIDAALAHPKPNVVVILTDDQTLESMRVMPHVQALLADEGTTFSNYVDTFPLCCPSRATLLTGQYAHNHHVVNNIAFTAAPNAPIGGSGALDHTNTLATWLHDSGYQTAHIGKYLNCWANNTTPCRAGTPAVPPGWDDWFGLIDPYPANYDYFSFDALDNTQTRHFGPAADIYQTDVLADRAVDDIEHMAARQQPFFLNIWPQAPHAGGGTTAPNAFSPAPAPRHTNLFTTETPPNGPAVGETDVSDKPAYIRCTFGLTPNAPPGPGCPNPPTATWTATGLAPTYRATLQSLQAVDELVARVVDTLAATGELDNTVIIYTSDNGYTFGEHRLKYRKIVPYEESVHVPLIIRGPGFPAGHTAPQPTANIDIAPTIVDLTGITAHRTPDGRPLQPIAQNPTTATNRAILLEDWPTGTFTGIPPHYDAVRTPTDVYIQYATGENEYYDLTNDPHQLNSLHNDPTTTTRRTTLTTLINQLKTCAGPTCQLTAPP